MLPILIIIKVLIHHILRTLNQINLPILKTHKHTPSKMILLRMFIQPPRLITFKLILTSNTTHRFPTNKTHTQLLKPREILTINALSPMILLVNISKFMLQIDKIEPKFLPYTNQRQENRRNLLTFHSFLDLFF